MLTTMNDHGCKTTGVPDREISKRDCRDGIDGSPFHREITAIRLILDPSANSRAAPEAASWTCGWRRRIIFESDPVSVEKALDAGSDDPRVQYRDPRR
jgi:hypothetical protein